MTLSNGEIVQLKSSGPKMTVKGTVGDDKHFLSKNGGDWIKNGRL